jgi:hypothetical protein
MSLLGDEKVSSAAFVTHKQNNVLKGGTAGLDHLVIQAKECPCKWDRAEKRCRTIKIMSLMVGLESYKQKNVPDEGTNYRHSELRIF